MNFIPILLFFLITSCATYTSESKEVRDQMVKGQFKEAITTLDKSPIATRNRDFVLYKMEKGMLLFLDRSYDLASDNWGIATDRIDELYTTSISKTAASFVYNDSVTDYEGEAHEKLLLPIFSAVSYLANNEPNKSMIEVRKSYEVLNYLESENNGKNNFKSDAFIHYFSGFVYEMQGNWDGAIVEYRNAIENFSRMKQNEQDKVNINLFLSPLGRLAEYRHRDDMISLVNQFKKKDTSWESQDELLKNGEVFILYEVGQSPIKVPIDIPLPIMDQIVRISFPAYQDISYFSHYAQVFVDNKYVGQTQTVEDIGFIAKQALEDRRLRDIVKMTARLVLKYQINRKLDEVHPGLGLLGNAFNVITETADTRSWTSLPDKLQVLRVKIPANKNVSFIIKPQAGQDLNITLSLKPQEKKFIRLRSFL